MRRTLMKYGQTLHLIGGNLVYISNMVHPHYTNGIVSDYDQYSIDLENAISVAQTSIQSLETVSPPYMLDREHELLMKSFKGILNCLNNLFSKMEELIPKELMEEDIQQEILKLKSIEQELNVATAGLIGKIQLPSRR